MNIVLIPSANAPARDFIPNDWYSRKPAINCWNTTKLLQWTRHKSRQPYSMLYIDSCCCLSLSFLLHLYPEYSLPEKHIQQVCWAATLINDERNSAIALEGIFNMDLVWNADHECNWFGMTLNLVKSWSPTSNVVPTWTRTLLPLSAAATGNPDSPTFSQSAMSRVTLHIIY